MRRPVIAIVAIVAVVAGLAVGMFVGRIAPAVGPSADPSRVAEAGRPSVVPESPAPSPSPPGPTASPTPTATPSPTPVPTPTLVPAPLDGVLVPPAVAARHPIAVMIDDLSPARPQSGFSSASVVWQAPAEGGIPRYMMVFQETIPTLVGPVRSSRYYYIAWAAEWRAVYAHAGGSPQALKVLRNQGSGQLVYNADEFRWGNSFSRTDRNPPHNLYSDGKHLRAIAKTVKAADKPLKPVWTFGPDARIKDRPRGGRIETAYRANHIRYDYDWKTNTYLRSVSVEGKEFDAATGKRVAPKNVVVMLMKFGPLSDDSTHHRLEADVNGSGTAWIATNGKTIKGTWRKKSLTAPTEFFDPKGHEVTLTVGQTFVQVMETGTAVKVVAGSPAQSGPRPNGQIPA
jgi:Protein of unknown function (DUF3048) N-terminal domain/Protein of unknown function (DUF3048) C-terminal domain